MFTGELDRKIEVAQSILARLNIGEPLSNVLSQVHLLSNMAADSVKVALIDILTHGITKIPYQGIPFADPAYKSAGLEYTNLCAIEDISKMNIDRVIERLIEGEQRDAIPERTLVVTLSVFEMENRKPPPQPALGTETELLNVIFQQKVMFDEIKSILSRLRAYIYDYVSGIWLEAIREKDRIQLLGRDYRLITDKLDALETPVGGALLAAIDNLRSDNPQNWSLCALGCRNVIIQLSTMLWKVKDEIYVTQKGEKLEVTGEKEKNRLLAYLDVFSKQVNPSNKEPFDEARKLIHSIYGKGSKGKRQIRHSEAQSLVIDTFNLISLLDKATELKPVDSFSKE